jgi:hypothetical protein
LSGDAVDIGPGAVPVPSGLVLPSPPVPSPPVPPFGEVLGPEPFGPVPVDEEVVGLVPGPANGLSELELEAEACAPPSPLPSIFEVPVSSVESDPQAASWTPKNRRTDNRV